jgi:hypothetical protein
VIANLEALLGPGREAIGWNRETGRRKLPERIGAKAKAAKKR